MKWLFYFMLLAVVAFSYCEAPSDDLKPKVVGRRFVGLIEDVTYVPSAAFAPAETIIRTENMVVPLHYHHAVALGDSAWVVIMSDRCEYFTWESIDALHTLR